MGKLHGDHAIHHLMTSMVNLLKSQTFADLRKTLLHPTLAKNLLGDDETSFQSLNLKLDALSSRKPPQKLIKLLEYVKGLKDSDDEREKIQLEKIRKLENTLEFIINKVREFDKLKSKELGLSLLKLCQNKDQSTSDYEKKFAAEVSESIEEILVNLNPESNEGTKLKPTEWIELALSISREERFRKNFTEEPINLPGWMEAMWEPVPHVVIFGLTDDLIPQSHNADPFLPSRLRNELGLTTSDNHFANAAFSLERIRRCRTVGRVDIIVPRHDNDGNGLRPSRLFFLCSDNELIKRVHILFESELETESQPYWEIPQELRLNPVAKAEKLARRQNHISATGFEGYLSNPADFWLKSVLQLNETSHDDVELNRAEFGTLIHSVLETFGRDPNNHHLTDPAEIARKLSGYLEKHFKFLYGDEPESSLILQKETAKDRLIRFSETQSKLVKEGWCIKEVEGILPPVIFNGIEVGGRFDRLDYQAATNTFRVYDYKTYDKLEKNTPEARHWANVTKINTKEIPDFQFHIEGEKTKTKPKDKFKVWRNLQLPVYYHNLTVKREGSEVKDYPEINEDNLEVGYILLVAEGSPIVRIWKDYKKYHKHAIKAINLITERIRNAKPEFFAFERDAKHPVYENFSKRKPDTYLDVNKLGTTEIEPK
jgi:hypothetical protein